MSEPVNECRCFSARVTLGEKHCHHCGKPLGARQWIDATGEVFFAWTEVVDFPAPLVADRAVKSESLSHLPAAGDEHPAYDELVHNARNLVQGAVAEYRGVKVGDKIIVLHDADESFEQAHCTGLYQLDTGDVGCSVHYLKTGHNELIVDWSRIGRRTV